MLQWTHLHIGSLEWQRELKELNVLMLSGNAVLSVPGGGGEVVCLV